MAKETRPKESGKPGAPEELTEPVLMGKGNIIILGVSLIAAALVLGYLVFALWAPPEVDISTEQDEAAAQVEANAQGETDAEGEADAEGETTKASEVEVTLFGKKVRMSDEVRLVLLVMLVGLIGSYIHAVTSFVNFAGNRRLVKSWLWYYAVRPLAAGPFLALVFYLVLRGGLLSAGVGSESINQYGILAVSGLAGMFSKQAIAKLKEIFDNFFRTRQPEKLEDKMSGSKPK